MKTEDLKKKYLEHHGNICPFCGSSKLTTGDHQFYVNTCWRNVACEDCNQEWTDEYTLTDVLFECPEHLEDCDADGFCLSCGKQ